MVWEIWKERCRALHIGDRPKSEAVIRMALKLVDESWNTRKIRDDTVRRGRDGQRGEVWKKPEYGAVKINTDASWIASTTKGGTGVIARDCDGRIIVRRNTTYKDVNIKNLEGKTIFQAVELVVLHKWCEVTIESDAQ